MARYKRPALLLLVAAIAVTVAALAPAEVSAQCALCKTAVQQGGGDAARAMNLGILILLVPPVAIFCAIFAVAYRHEKGDGERK